MGSTLCLFRKLLSRVCRKLPAGSSITTATVLYPPITTNLFLWPLFAPLRSCAHSLLIPHTLTRLFERSRFCLQCDRKLNVRDRRTEITPHHPPVHFGKYSMCFRKKASPDTMHF